MTADESLRAHYPAMFPTDPAALGTGDVVKPDAPAVTEDAGHRRMYPTMFPEEAPKATAGHGTK
jgi:hypothetical protein